MYEKTLSKAGSAAVFAAALLAGAASAGSASAAGLSISGSFLPGVNQANDYSGEIWHPADNNSSCISSGSFNSANCRIQAGDSFLSFFTFNSNTVSGAIYDQNSPNFAQITGVFAVTVGTATANGTTDISPTASVNAVDLTFLPDLTNVDVLLSAAGLNTITVPNYGLALTNVDVNSFAAVFTDTANPLPNEACINGPAGIGDAACTSQQAVANKIISGTEAMILDLSGSNTLKATSVPADPFDLLNPLAQGGFQVGSVKGSANIGYQNIPGVFFDPTKVSVGGWLLVPVGTLFAINDHLNVTLFRKVPEPSSLGILGMSLAGIGWFWRRRRPAA